MKPLIILAGPTAAGKTSLSISLAKTVGGEIISADSVQVYRQMDIGSAKITVQEMQGVPHHLIDVLDPREEFHVVKFQQMANDAIREIYRRGNIPILTGGTGFYIQAILREIDFSDDSEDSLCRRKWETLLNEKGSIYLHEQLALVDSVSAEKIHPNNTKRVIRALEYYEQTGQPISTHNEEQKQKESPFQYVYFVLTDNRERLYARIDQRVDEMLEQGLVDEVRRLKALGCHRGMISMQGLGYKEILSYLDGECSLEEAVYQLKRDTRHFAKRQLTWFRREKDVVWLDQSAPCWEDGQLLPYMTKILENKGIIEHAG